MHSGGGGGVRRTISFEVLRNLSEDEDEDNQQQQQEQPKVRKRRRRRRNRKALSLSLSSNSSADLAAFAGSSSLVSDPGASTDTPLLGNGDTMHGTTVEGNGNVMEGSVLEGTSSCISEATTLENHVTILEDHGSTSVCTSEERGASLDATSTTSVEDHPIPPVLHSSLHSPLLRQRPLSSVEKVEHAFSRSNSKKLEPNTMVIPPPPPAFDLNGNDHVDWQQVMTDDAEGPEAEFSPIQYVADELRTGTWMTTRAGNDKCRERVYNVLFFVPWRCELLIDVGFFVCLDSFLSLLTVMPIRLCMSLWKSIRRQRVLQAEDIYDLGCLAILILGVYVVQLADISFIYHSIRFEPNIKLYMIYNMLEVFDKLFQSFGVDVLEVLFNSTVVYSACTSDRLRQFLVLCFDWLIAVGCFILHSFIILSEAITISAALHHAATNYKSLLILLMSNNFAEIKSNVFKRFNKDNMHNLAHTDTVERFHILTCLFFVFVQNIMIVEGPWMTSFLHNASMVMLCEAFVDLLKHSFLAKFNQVKPSAYSEFLTNLCEQVLSSRKKDSQKALHFVPIGPACVVIRVLLPLYGAFMVSQNPWKNWLWSIILALGTFTFLAATKVVVGFTLRTYAAWYLRRYRSREGHHHAD